MDPSGKFNVPKPLYVFLFDLRFFYTYSVIYLSSFP